MAINTQSLQRMQHTTRQHQETLERLSLWLGARVLYAGLKVMVVQPKRRDGQWTCSLRWELGRRGYFTEVVEQPKGEALLRIHYSA